MILLHNIPHQTEFLEVGNNEHYHPFTRRYCCSCQGSDQVNNANDLMYLAKNFPHRTALHSAGVKSFISGWEKEPPWSPYVAVWMGIKTIYHHLQNDLKCCKENMLKMCKEAVVKWNTALFIQ